MSNRVGRGAALAALAAGFTLLLGACSGSVGTGGTPTPAEQQTPPNRAPTISGSSSVTVAAGSALRYRPTASDPDGQSLTFRVTSLPGWASFDAATGTITGTPVAANAGTYNVTVYASDGSLEASLGVTITVTQASGTPAPGVTGSATVSWTPPTTRTDGSALTNLAGYRIYYGTSQDALTTRIEVTTTAVTSWVIDNLAAGTWFFVVTAVDSTGGESAFSNTASKTIS